MSTNNTGALKLVAFLLFDEMDLLDFGGPYEVLLTANRLSERAGDPTPFRVHTVSPDGQPVTAYGGVGLTPAGSVADIERTDVAIIPGTIDPKQVTADPAITAAVAALTADASITASVCTGSYLLGHIGLLDNRDWTTHWEDIADLQQQLALRDDADSRLHGRSDRIVDTGRVVTAGALACGLDLGLHLVARLVSPNLARQTARQVDFPWGGHSPHSQRRIGETGQG